MRDDERTHRGGARGPGFRALSAVALAALAVAGCGGDGDDSGDAPTSPPPGPGERPADEGPDAATAPEPEEGPAAGEPEAPRTGAGGPEPCVFEAPPGRLAEDTVEIELAGASCAEARGLAKAAALGQPAGANLEIERGGFRCVPSTTTKGANVTYTCTRGADQVRFDVAWTAQGG